MDRNTDPRASKKPADEMQREMDSLRAEVEGLRTENELYRHILRWVSTSWCGKLAIRGYRWYKRKKKPNCDCNDAFENTSVMVLTDQYPEGDELYRNMFVHDRVRSYREEGVAVGVFCMRMDLLPGRREYEGVPIVEGGVLQLNAILTKGCVQTVCVHFLNKQMWSVLKFYLSSIRLLIWIHGAEIQPWYRRPYLYTSPNEQVVAKQQRVQQQAFWQEIFQNTDGSIEYIFVSRWLQRTVFEDYGIVPPQTQCHIIHNGIDTAWYRYYEKTDDMRNKILVVRPFTSATYANDVMVKTILFLSETLEFPHMEFFVFGNGDLYEETVKPLRGFANVYLHKGYLNRQEIVFQHRKCGLFLVPTRSDTQGVSRDEAMSSGLVPITNAVAAVPEFVDAQCSILAPAEDHVVMAEGILNLYNDPSLFHQMSKASAKRVRNQSAKKKMIQLELQLITKFEE